MTAISKNWVTINDGAVDADSPIDQTLMTGIRDDLVHLREWLGASFTGGAIQDHNHDGSNSALIEVGPNYIRNPSFETSTTGWTITQYTGGTVGTNTSNDMDGATALAFTSTSTVNGGGDAITTAYTPVSVSGQYDFRLMVRASVSNVSSRAEVVWYDDAQAQISTTNIYSSTSTETTATAKGNRLRAPSTAKYARVRIVGGVPGSGSSTGTVYFDGLLWFVACPVMQSGSVLQAHSETERSTNNTGYEKVKEVVVPYDGVLSINFDLKSGGGSSSWGRIYKNGSAVGTERTTTSTSYVTQTVEDLSFAGGDLLQIYARATAADTTQVRRLRIMAQAAFVYGIET